MSGHSVKAHDRRGRSRNALNSTAEDVATKAAAIETRRLEVVPAPFPFLPSATPMGADTHRTSAGPLSPRVRFA